jgi:tripartite-type tricarboxylate transporter receptor subunit TctC
MFSSLRSCALAFAACSAAALVPSIAGAQNWPTRPVTLVVPFAAGSGLDIIGRIMTVRLSELLGQQVVIENVGGGGGMTGTARVANAAPDGYQFVVGSVDTFAINQTLYKKPLYNAVTDFVPVGLITDQPMVLIGRGDLPADNLKEFAAYAKANQAKMQFASSGLGSAAHLTCSRVNAALGIETTHLPYRGSAQALQDLMAGRIDYYCALGAAAVGPLENKKAKAIAVLTRDRSPLFDGIASAHEQGLTNFHTNFWSGVFLPKGTPDAIVQKLNQAFVETLNTPAVQERLQKVGVTVTPADRRSPAYLKNFVDSEIKDWEGIIKASGVSLE